MNERVDLKCISMMDNDSFAKWDAIKTKYSKPLNSGTIISKIAFTAHDYDRHCINIYKYASELLFREEMYSQIGPDNLLAFNVAVLLHDYSMCKFIDFDRRQHQKQSVECIKRDRDNEKGVGCLSEIDDSIFEVVCDMINAHSDDKKDNIDTLQVVVMKKYLTDMQKMLAAMLRLADELDITSTRLEKNKFYQLEEYIEEKSILDLNEHETEELNQAKNSYNHWLKCKYVRYLGRAECDKTQVNVMCDSDLIKQSGDEDNIRVLLKEKEDELNKKVTEINQVLKRFENSAVYFKPINEFQFVDMNSERLDLNQRNAVIKKEDDENELNDNLKEELALDSNKKKVILLSDEFSVKISKWVTDNDLLRPGHFRINNDLCGREWILCDNIILNNEFLEKIIENLTRSIIEIYGPELSNMMLLGVGNNGVILSSVLGVRLDLPFSFTTATHEVEKHADVDIATLLEGDKNVILIFDVGVTYSSFYKLKEEVEKINSKVVGIFTVFHREPIIYNKDTAYEMPTIEAPIYTLNNEFDIEAFHYSKCYIKSNRCISCNKMLN